MERSRSGILLMFVLGILLILAWGMYMWVSGVQNTTLGPISSFSTQAAETFNPTPTILPDPVTIIRDIRSLARLETIQYSLEKVITAETGQGTFSFLFGDRILFVAHGTVIAGVDMERLGPEDLRVEGDVLYVTLPEAEVFIATLDNDKSYVYDRETGFLTKGEVNLDTTARQVAEDEILNAALEDGILQQAQTNAENFMYRLLRDLGYSDVVFVKP